MLNQLKDKLQDLGEAFFRKLGEGDYGTSSRSYIDEAYAQMASFHKLCDLFPYDSYDEKHQLFINEDSIGFVLETCPLVGSCEKTQQEISNLFQSIFPEESGMQFLFWADPHIGDKCDAYVQARAGREEIYQTLAKQRAEYLKSFAFNSPHAPYTLRNFRCILSFNQPLKGNLIFALEETRQILNQTKATLEMIRLPIKIWHPEDLINTLDGILHLDPAKTVSSKFRWNKLQKLSDQLYSAESNLVVNYGCLKLNNNKGEARIFKVRQYPNIWSLHAMGMLIGDEERDLAQIPCPFIIHYGIYIPKQDGYKTKTLAKAKYVERQANSPLGDYLPSIKREAAELGYVREQLGKDGRILHTQLNVILMGTPEALTTGEQILKNYYKGREWTLEKQSFIALPIFLTCMPMMWDAHRMKDILYLETTKTTLNTEAENILPIQGEWYGTKTPGVLLAGRRGQILQWFPFDGNSGNYSVVVVGKSGSGKSVFMQEMMAACLGLGGKAFVMDLGRSFEKTCAALRGQYIQFTPNSDLCLNPFSTIARGDLEEEKDALGMLKSVLALMASPSGNISDIEAAILEQAMNETWNEKGNESSIDDIAQKLLKDSHSRAQDLGKMLFPYTSNGNYGRFFNGPSNVNLDNPLVVVEFSELDSRKELKAVIVHSMMLKLMDRLYKSERKKPNMLFVDEASDSLECPGESKLYGKAARRVRKYEGSIVFGTQTVNDFFATPGAQAAFNNCDWKCYFNQNQEAIELLKESKRLLLTPHQEHLLKSLRTIHGKYSELMITGLDGYAVGRLLLDPFTGFLYSSKGEEYSAVKAMMEEGYTVQEALEYLMNQRKAA